MHFAIIFMFRAFGLNRNRLYVWVAENEGDLPDDNFVFEAGNGYGLGASIRPFLPRSLSVGDYFAVIPLKEPIIEFVDPVNFLLNYGNHYTEILPVGFKHHSVEDYLR